MKIAEIFYSIQGEGPWMGVPCVFIRLSGCNLRCAWCDTPYASWHPEGSDYSVVELQTRLGEWPRAAVVITGGEPFLFRDLPLLCNALRAEGRPVALETSGSLYQPITCDLLVVSPKLSASDPDSAQFPVEYARHHKGRTDLEPLRSLLAEHHGAILKCVVGSVADVAEVRLLAAKLALPPERIWLMPLAAEPGPLALLAPQVVEWALAAGYRYTDRLHVRLWGNVKGK
jgi:7-carboxy-7-deazaguanine synthase